MNTPGFTCSKYYGDNSFTERVLINNELYFAPLSAFNDPYESLFSIVDNPYSEIVIKYSDFAVTLKDKNTIDQYFTQRKILFTNLFQDTGVCCFSKIPNNQLMWSHYADSHRGMCLIFDFKKDSNLHSLIDSVTYRPDILEINLFENGNVITEKAFLDRYLIDQYVNVLFTKSKIWSYEEELRMAVKTPGARNFNPSCLTFVIFGFNMPEKRKAELAEIIYDKYPAVMILEVVLNNISYYMKFQEWQTKQMVMFTDRIKTPANI